VKRHQPAVRDQRRVELEVSAYAFVAVVAVDEEKVDHSPGQASTHIFNSRSIV
jgi:hypothetical protein